jgi:hypothetical protein
VTHTAPRSKKVLSLAIGALLVASAVIALTTRPDRAAHVAAGLAAHTICSTAHISGLDPHSIDRELIQPLTGLPGHLLSFKVDGAGAEAWFAGLAHARAHFVSGYGCRLELPGDTPEPIPLRLESELSPDALAPAHVADPSDPELKMAIDRLFTERPDEDLKNVKAVVVVKEGQVIAERYAKGYGTILRCSVTRWPNL